MAEIQKRDQSWTWNDYSSASRVDVHGISVSATFGTPVGYYVLSADILKDGFKVNVGLGYPDWGVMKDDPLRAISTGGEVTYGFGFGSQKSGVTDLSPNTVPVICRVSSSCLLM